MSTQDAFDRILTSFHAAMLDETLWPATSALIDDACGMQSNGLLVGEGPPDDIRALFVGIYSRGQRRADWEREWIERYHPLDECVPRFRQLPDSHVVHIRALYTAAELKTSLAYNEGLRQFGGQEGLRARLAGAQEEEHENSGGGRYQAQTGEAGRKERRGGSARGAGARHAPVDPRPAGLAAWVFCRRGGAAPTAARSRPARRPSPRVRHWRPSPMQPMLEEEFIRRASGQAAGPGLPRQRPRWAPGVAGGPPALSAALAGCSTGTCSAMGNIPWSPWPMGWRSGGPRSR